MPPSKGRPRCPDCGRPVHRLPGGRLYTLMPAPGGRGWTLGPHACLPRGCRYGAPPIEEVAPLPGSSVFGWESGAGGRKPKTEH
jgi:hypothetical protein